jgi:hypothetical protein
MRRTSLPSSLSRSNQPELRTQGAQTSRAGGAFFDVRTRGSTRRPTSIVSWAGGQGSNSGQPHAFELRLPAQPDPLAGLDSFRERLAVFSGLARYGAMASRDERWMVDVTRPSRWRRTGWWGGTQWEFDLRGLAAEEACDLALKAVEAAWKRGFGEITLRTGASRGGVSAARRRSLWLMWIHNDFDQWAYHRKSTKHRVSPATITLALRPNARPIDAPLPNLHVRAAHVMRATEAALTDAPQTIHAIAAAVFDTTAPTRAQVESVRRAAKRLAGQHRARIDFATQTHRRHLIVSAPAEARADSEAIRAPSRVRDDPEVLARSPFLWRKFCQECGGPFTARRHDARYCSARCRKRAQRRREARSNS